MKRLCIGSPRRKTRDAAALRLTIHAATGRQYIRFLRKHLLAAHRQIRPALAELSVALVGDTRMSSLHQQFMGIAGPTDVLTFPLEFDASNCATAGEIVICVPQAIRQAQDRKTRADRELLLYALHGMLHLCGFDDRTDAAFRQMHRMEDDILTRLGLGPVFGDVDPGDARRKAIGKAARNANRAN
jgi:probable rRNA maturation factor